MGGVLIEHGNPMTGPEWSPGPFHGSSRSHRHSAAVDSAVELLEQQLALLWRRERSMSRQMARDAHPDMGPAAYGLLAVLQREGPLRLSDIAAILDLGKPSLSRQITSLEHRGLLRKETDPRDARARTLSLTPAGTTHLEAARRSRARALHRQLSGWDINDLTTLADLMHRLNTTDPATDRPAKPRSG